MSDSARKYVERTQWLAWLESPMHCNPETVREPARDKAGAAEFAGGRCSCSGMTEARGEGSADRPRAVCSCHHE